MELPMMRVRYEARELSLSPIHFSVSKDTCRHSLSLSLDKHKDSCVCGIHQRVSSSLSLSLSSEVPLFSGY